MGPIPNDPWDEAGNGGGSYRARVGFFATQGAAQKLIDAQEDSWGDLWEQAQIVELENFEEAMPGQQIKVTRPRS